MNCKFVTASLAILLLGIFLSQVSSAFIEPGRSDEEVLLPNRRSGVRVPNVAEWLGKKDTKDVVGERQEAGAAAETTSKRPQQIGDIIGGGLQNIFQGIVRAPGQIANRVQQVISGILRRPNTPTTAPATAP